MSVRSWIAIVLGTLMMPAADAAVESVATFSDSAYVFADTQGYEAAPSDVASSSVPVNGYGARAVSPLGFWKIAFLDSGKCRPGNCYQLRVTAFAQMGGRQPEASAVHGSGSDSGAMTTLDCALMVVFAAGLLAYQLDRKQRLLQQSSLFSVSL
jgi:hypothetical protein